MDFDNDLIMRQQFVQGEAFFVRINDIEKQYRYLNKDIDTDVIIVGGGVTGSILSYYMSKNGIKCTVLEKGRIGHGSTSITTSLLQYELDSNARELEQYTTLDKIILSYKLGLKALDELEEFIKENGNHCDYKKRDTLLYTAKNSEIGEMKEEYEVRKNAGIDVKYISQEDNPFGFDLKAGVYGVNGGAELDPIKYTHQLLDYSEKKGADIYENTEVTEIRYSEGGVDVITSYGYKVHGNIIVCCTGYNTSLFTDRNFGIKTTTFNVATKPLNDLKGYYNNVLIRDNCDPYNYLRTTPDKRIIIGGEDIDFTPGIFSEKRAKEKYDILEQRLKSMFKDIDDIEIDYRYCGAFASTQDNLGFIGKDPNNDKLWYDLGYGANGILFAILGGIMLSDLHKGKINENMNLFRVDRFDS